MTNTEALEFQLAAKQRIKEMLSQQELVPRELIFVGRAMNLIRFNNKITGAPVNRIRVFALAAARGAHTHQRFVARLWFRLQLLMVTWSYRLLGAWHRTRTLLTGNMANAEDTLEEQEKRMIRQQLHLRDEQKLGFAFKAEQLG